MKFESPVKYERWKILIFLYFAVKRSLTVGPSYRQQFSRLISQLRQESQDRAVKLLEVAFEKLDETQQPNIAQTLSR